MKILKYALIAMGGLVIVIGAVLAYIAATFDPNQYKPQIVQAVKERTQRTLKLEGDIGLSFWPSIGAKIGKASLSERASDREFAAVEEVRVALKLMPLLSGKAIVDTVRVRGLRASIVKAKDGRTNVDDLAGPPPAKGSARRRRTPGRISSWISRGSRSRMPRSATPTPRRGRNTCCRSSTSRPGGWRRESRPASSSRLAFKATSRSSTCRSS